jgi:ABC-2 type transport system permease protein
MNKILLIIKREYVTRVKRKVFVVTTFLAPLGLAAITFLPAYLINHGMEEEKIALYDESGIFSGKMVNSSNLTYGHINTKNVPYDSLKVHYAESGFKGILRIPSAFNVDQPADVEFYSADQLGVMTKSDITNQMTEVLRKIRLEEANISPAVMDKLNTPVNIIQPELKLGNAETSTWLGYAMGFYDLHCTADLRYPRDAGSDGRKK